MNTPTQEIKRNSGGKGKEIKDIPPSRLPTDEDLAFAQKYDVGYGQSKYPGGKGRVTSFEDFKQWYETQSPFRGVKVTDLAPQQKRDLETVFLGARKSAIATIGFDPSKLVQLDSDKFFTNPSGVYAPPSRKAEVFDASGKKQASIEIGRGTDSDTMYSGQVMAPSTVLHESLHRGIEMMRQAGMKGLPREGRDEEIVVRALMHKHYGNVEHEENVKALRKAGASEENIKKNDADKVFDDEQVGQGFMLLKKNPKLLEDLEKKAQEFLEKERKGRRGPA